jgi:predicted hydrocarbon binding protein
MQGTLFGLVKETLEGEYGEGMWESLVAACERNGAWQIGGDDGHRRTGEPLPDDLPSDALICWLGRRAVPRLASAYPTLFRRHENLRSFIRAFGRGLPSAGVRVQVTSPAFSCFDAMDGELIVAMNGPTRVCALAEGVIAGAADFYDEAVTVEELKCVHRGDNRCVLRVRFGQQATRPDWQPDGLGVKTARPA